MYHFLLLQYLLYMNPAIGLNFDLISEHCFVFNSRSQIRACNRVCSKGLPTRNEIAKIKEYFGNVNFTWVIDAEDKDLSTILEQNNFKLLLSLPAMSAELNVLPPYSDNPSISVKEISADSPEINQWTLIAATGFERSFIELEKAIEHYKKIVMPGNLQFYLGYFDNNPVTALMVLKHDDIVTLHWLATLKEFRKKGLGFITTHKALSDAKLQGIKQAVLLSSEHAKRIYERLGFKEYAFYHVYGN